MSSLPPAKIDTHSEQEPRIGPQAAARRDRHEEFGNVAVNLNPCARLYGRDCFAQTD